MTRTLLICPIGDFIEVWVSRKKPSVTHSPVSVRLKGPPLPFGLTFIVPFAFQLPAKQPIFWCSGVGVGICCCGCVCATDHELTNKQIATTEMTNFIRLFFYYNSTHRL